MNLLQLVHVCLLALIESEKISSRFRTVFPKWSVSVSRLCLCLCLNSSAATHWDLIKKTEESFFSPMRQDKKRPVSGAGRRRVEDPDNALKKKMIIILRHLRDKTGDTGTPHSTAQHHSPPTRMWAAMGVKSVPRDFLGFQQTMSSGGERKIFISQQTIKNHLLKLNINYPHVLICFIHFIYAL